MSEFVLYHRDQMVKTPLGHPVIVPTEALLRLAADEWAQMDKEKNPNDRPMDINQRVFAVHDRSASDWALVRQGIVQHLVTDTVCFLMPQPNDWADTQRKNWWTLLERLSHEWGIVWGQSSNLSVVKHPAATITWFQDQLMKLDAYGLAALEWCVNLTASPIVSLALFKGVIMDEEAWRLSHLEVLYQTQHWGMEPELKIKLDQSKREISLCYRFYQASLLRH